MRMPVAAVGSAAFFLIAPGTVAAAVPWWLTGWQAHRPWWLPLRVAGAVVVLAAAAVLGAAFVRFVAEGAGTPAPVAPTEVLVVGGLYRYVRNPMYVAVVAAVLGQALLLGRAVLVGYAAAVWLCMAAFARWYEEPALTRRYGALYQAYRRAVPAWRPRLRPWTPDVAAFDGG
jgi:protein-S-isoprenylcysteine O-methyltransferase Ste14